MTIDNEKDILKLLATEQSRQEGFRLLVKIYKKPIYWHIRRLVIKHEDTEDVMQETFINIYRAIDKFKGESSLKTWIYKIATNEAIRLCKSRKLDMDLYDERSKLINVFEAEANIDFKSAEATLQKAILSLPEKQRVVFNLRYFEELSYEQIATITSSSVATLKTNFHYASSKVKEYVQNNIEIEL